MYIYFRYKTASDNLTVNALENMDVAVGILFVGAVEFAICRAYWVDEVRFRGHEISAFSSNRWGRYMCKNVKTSVVFMNRFSEANYCIIFAEKVMPEKNYGSSGPKVEPVKYNFWPGH